MGAPEWMVTYGDMMTLLLCFFVILVSMSEIKEEEKFQKVSESIKRAFGYKGGVGTIAGSAVPNNTFDKKMTELILRKWQLQLGKSTDEGIEGVNPSVKTIREGLEYTIGGRVHFELGKAVLLEHAKENLDAFIDVIQGLNNKIRVCGHAARVPSELYHPFKSLDDLTYARGTAVKKHLILRGIRPERITVEACGANEPLRAQAYNDENRAVNDRVSIIITETLIADVQGEPALNSENVGL